MNVEFPTLSHVDEGVPIGFLGHTVGSYDFSVGAGTFYRALERGHLELPSCPSCDVVLHPRREACPTCFNVELEQQQVATGGSVYSFSTMHRSPFSAHTHELPISVGIVELDAGVHLFGRLDVPLDQISITQRVELDLAASTAGLVFASAESGLER